MAMKTGREWLLVESSKLQDCCSSTHFQFVTQQPHHVVPMSTTPATCQGRHCTMMYDIHKKQCPAYQADACCPVTSASTLPGLQSAVTTDYVLPRLHSEFNQQPLVYMGPTAWNHLQHQSTVASFRKHLKTFLFNESFNHFKLCYLLFI